MNKFRTISNADLVSAIAAWNSEAVLDETLRRLPPGKPDIVNDMNQDHPREIFMRAVRAEFSNGRVSWEDAWRTCEKVTHATVYAAWMADIETRKAGAEFSNTPNLGTKEGVAQAGAMIQQGKPMGRDIAAELARSADALGEFERAMDGADWSRYAVAHQDFEGRAASKAFMMVVRKLQETSPSLGYDGAWDSAQRRCPELYAGMSKRPAQGSLSKSSGVRFHDKVVGS